MIKFNWKFWKKAKKTEESAIQWFAQDATSQKLAGLPYRDIEKLRIMVDRVNDDGGTVSSDELEAAIDYIRSTKEAEPLSRPRVHKSVSAHLTKETEELRKYITTLEKQLADKPKVDPRRPHAGPIKVSAKEVATEIKKVLDASGD